MSVNVKELREERVKLVEDARAEFDKIKPDTSAAEAKEIEARFDTMMNKADDLKRRIDRAEALEAEERALEQVVEQRAGRTPTGERDPDPSKDKARETEQRANAVFGQFLRSGMQGMTNEDRAVMQELRASLSPEARALAVGTDTAGGYTAPESFRAQLIEVIKSYGGMRQVADVLTTASGTNMRWPTADDTTNEGAIIGENQQIGEQDTEFGEVDIGSYMYTSKIIRVSLQLLQDSAFNLETYLRNIIGRRIGRVTNRHFTVGTGVNQPRGVVTAATLGKTAGAGQVDSVIYDDFIDLEHSVPVDYRTGMSWMFHDDMLKIIRKLKTPDGMPMWQPGLLGREPDTILTRPYTVNMHMPQPAAGETSMLLGDFKHYLIRDVMDLQIVRFGEKYMDYLQVGYMAFSRHDGDLIDAGVGPIRSFVQAAA